MIDDDNTDDGVFVTVIVEVNAMFEAGYPRM